MDLTGKLTKFQKGDRTPSTYYDIFLELPIKWRSLIKKIFPLSGGDIQSCVITRGLLCHIFSFPLAPVLKFLKINTSGPIFNKLS